MKKLLALLLCLLLLAQFVPASAETVQDVFTSANIEVGTVLTEQGSYFSLEIHRDIQYKVQDSDGYYIIGDGSPDIFMIKAENGYTIDEVGFTISYVNGGSTITPSSGTPSSISVSRDTVVSIVDINASEIALFSNKLAQTHQITVIGHKLDAPATGDGTPIALLGCALVVSAFALAEIRRRRVHA